MKRTLCLLAALLVLLAMLPAAALADAPLPTLVWDGQTLTGSNGITVSSKTVTLNSNSKIKIINNSSEDLYFCIYGSHTNATYDTMISPMSSATTSEPIPAYSYQRHGTFVPQFAMMIELNYFKVKTIGNHFTVGNAPDNFSFEISVDGKSIESSGLSQVTILDIKNMNQIGGNLVTAVPPCVSAVKASNKLRIVFTKDFIANTINQLPAGEYWVLIQFYNRDDNTVSNFDAGKKTFGVFNIENKTAPATGDSMPLTAIALLMAACVVVVACLKARRVQA